METTEAVAVPKPAGYIRWIVCGILFLAVVISYIDRLVISVLKPTLAAEYNWSETGYADMAFYFQLVYGVAFLISGRIIDKIGAKAGYAFAMTIWTIGHVMHTLFTSTAGMILARLPLAMGEAATYPAALVAANSWFPKRERALAIGILNAGANVGAIVTPLLVPAIALTWGWRAAFIVTGLCSVVWLVVWLVFYRKPREHKLVTPAELAWIESDAATAEPVAPVEAPSKVTILQLLKFPQTWAYMSGRFLIDPVWWTFLFWLPAFFSHQFGVKLGGFGPPLVAIYLLADLGSIFGGYASSSFIKRGWHINKARKRAMLIMAFVVLPVASVTMMPNMWLAVLLIGMACAGHQGFSTNLFTIPGDLYPHHASGTVAGLGGLAGACGGMLMAKFAGIILQTTGGDYAPIFFVSSVAYLIAFGVVHLLCPRWEKVAL
jgi:MFS transporter, ACS family, hexuronate transporter